MMLALFLALQAVQLSPQGEAEIRPCRALAAMQTATEAQIARAISRLTPQQRTLCRGYFAGAADGYLLALAERPAPPARRR